MPCVRAWGVGSIWLWILARAKMALVIWKDTHFALMEGLRQGGMRGVV